MELNCARSAPALGNPALAATWSIGRSVASSSSRARLSRAWRSCLGLVPVSVSKRRISVPVLSRAWAARSPKAQRLVKIDLAEWTWAVMERGMPYVVCDTDGAPVTLEEAKAIIAEHWTVPEEVRRRRRSKKGRPLTKSSWDMHSSALVGRLRGDLPRGHRRRVEVRWSRLPLDSGSSIGNQSTGSPLVPSAGDTRRIVPWVSPPTGLESPSSIWATNRVGVGNPEPLSILMKGMAAMKMARGGSMISNPTAKAMPPK